MVYRASPTSLQPIVGPGYRSPNHTATSSSSLRQGSGRRTSLASVIFGGCPTPPHSNLPSQEGTPSPSSPVTEIANPQPPVAPPPPSSARHYFLAAVRALRGILQGRR